MIYFTYMLKCYKNKESCQRKRPIHGHLIYTGYTNNIYRRLTEHKNGKSYGKRTPFTAQFNGNLRLGFIEMYTTRKEAMYREDEIKNFSRDKKIKLMQEQPKEIQDIIRKINKKIGL